MKKITQLMIITMELTLNKTKDIPLDYEGIIRFPLHFINSTLVNLETIGFERGDDGKDLKVNGKTPYFRILVRNISLNKK